MANSELVQAVRSAGLQAILDFRAKRPKDQLDFSKAILPKLDLRRAPLFEADLSGAFLADTDLREADLRLAKLDGANLAGTKLAGAVFFRTSATGVDFNKAEGVERIEFEGPCDFGLSTILSVDKPLVRRALLRGCGVVDDILERICASQVEPKAIRSAFLAHVADDAATARWFQPRLEAAGIRCWPYCIDREHRSRPFKDILTDLRREEWVVFFASQGAMTNPLVDTYIEKLLQARKLQPVALDRHLSTEWEHAMRNDMMQLRIVKLYDCDTDVKREEAVQKLVAALRRGLPEHL